MDIKKLIAAYEELQVDSMEDETGVNEIVENLEKPADMEQAEYTEIKVEEPEVEELKEEIEKADYEEIKIEEPELDPAKKLLKQFEELEVKEIAPIEAKMEKPEVKEIKIEEPEVEELKEEKIDEISLENAEEVNTQRQIDSLKKTLQWKKTGEEIDREIAKEAKDKATKSNELLKKWKKAKGYKESLEELNEEEYTDRVDADFDISLYEYGVVRNPQNDQTLIGIKPSDDGLYTDYAVTYISLDDIKEVIENMEDGFFTYIDQPKEEILEILNNDHIAPYIQYVDSYNGYFRDQFYESIKEEKIKYYGVEYRDMHTAIHNLIYTDTKEKAEEILADLKQIEENPDTTVFNDEEGGTVPNSVVMWNDINDLAKDSIEINYRDVDDNGMYDDIFVINYDGPKPDIYESLKDSLESLVEKAINEEDIPKKYIVQDIDLNSVDPIPDSQDEFDNLNDAMNCLKKRHQEAPDKYIELVDTDNDTIIASTDEIEDGSLKESADVMNTNIELIDSWLTKLGYEDAQGPQGYVFMKKDGEDIKRIVIDNNKLIYTKGEEKKEFPFSNTLEVQKAFKSLSESINEKYSICKDMEKGYFYICSEDDVYYDPDGEPYHFEDRKEAEEFLQGLDESLNEEVIAKFDEGKHEIVKCDKGYYNRYNIKEGKARFTTKCVESLPTALSALKKRFPKAEEDK